MIRSLLIPFKFGGGDSLELRAALRSWTLFGGEIQDCFLIGDDRPSWFYGSQISYTQDKKYSSVVNVLGKLKKAFADPRITDDCWVSMDDVYLVGPVQEGPWFLRNPPHRSDNLHHRGMTLTIDELDRRSVTKWLDCELHAPILFNKHKALNLLNEIDTTLPYSFRTLYNNLLGVQLAPLNDQKVFHWMEPNPNKTWFWSTNDSALSTSKFKEWVYRVFPEKSAWEA